MGVMLVVPLDAVGVLLSTLKICEKGLQVELMLRLPHDATRGSL